MNKDLSDFLIEAVDRNRKLILDTFEYVRHNPETGFREVKTHRYLSSVFRNLGYEINEAGDIPGFTAVLDTGREGPTVLVFGEMDALTCPTHPDADPETGAVHACGHCCQVAGLVGIASALKEKGITDRMCGRIMLCVVPAEELIEISYREELFKRGTIKYFGGKMEFLRRGLLDGAQLCFMIHTGGKPANVVSAATGGNGCIAKVWTFRGKSSHAASPEKGINALYAVNTALTACNAIRETFPDESCLRFHPVITKSESAVNVIPDLIEVESYVRGSSMDTIVKANTKMNRAASASAAAMGAHVKIKDRPGFYPLVNNERFLEVLKEACDNGVCQFDEKKYWSKGCTDMGDMSALMPICYPHIGGATGAAHGDSYRITDPESACVSSAKVQLKMLQILLEDNASKAKEIISTYNPAFASKEEYFAYMDSLTFEKESVCYHENNKVTLDF